MFVRWRNRPSKLLEFIKTFVYPRQTIRSKELSKTWSSDYAYLVENYRDKGGKVKQRTIAYLGSSEKPSALSQKVNSVLSALPGLSKRNRLKIQKVIVKKTAGVIRIEDDRLVCEKPSRKEMTNGELLLSILEDLRL